MKRKPIPKATRQMLWDKYNHRCAYCGSPIELKDMQLDHIVPFGQAIYGGKYKDIVDKMVADGSINATDNLMPACRSCNFYKGIDDLETFRNSLLNILDRTCRDSFQVKLAMKYGMLSYHQWDGVFYFETLKQQDK